MIFYCVSEMIKILAFFEKIHWFINHTILSLIYSNFVYWRQPILNVKIKSLIRVCVGGPHTLKHSTYGSEKSLLMNIFISYY